MSGDAIECRPERSRQVRRFEFDSIGGQLSRRLLECSSFCDHLILGHFPIGSGSKFGVLGHISQLAIVEVDLLMERFEEVFVVRRARFSSGLLVDEINWGTVFEGWRRLRETGAEAVLAPAPWCVESSGSWLQRVHASAQEMLERENEFGTREHPGCLG